MVENAIEPCREPLYKTLLRTVAIAVIVGGILAFTRGGGFARWPMAALLVLWPSFGGHWIEVFFLNVLRPRLPANRAVQMLTRLALWFVAGIGLSYGMMWTATLITDFHPQQWLAWWMAGLGFIGVELIAHLFLQLRCQRSFYNGLG